MGDGPDGSAARAPLGGAAGRRGLAAVFLPVDFLVLCEVVFFGAGFAVVFVGAGVGVGVFGVRASRRLPRLHFQFSIVLSGSVPFLHSCAAAASAGGAASTRMSAPAETAAEAEPSRLSPWGMFFLHPMPCLKQPPCLKPLPCRAFTRPTLLTSCPIRARP